MSAVFLQSLIACFSRLFSSPKKHKLLEASGLSETELYNVIELKIQKELGLDIKLNSEFQVLGGSNNYGFVCHYSDGLEYDLVSKLSGLKLNLNEECFLKWHDQHIKSVDKFAPDFIAGGLVGVDNQFGFITTEKLSMIKNISDTNVFNLWKKLERGEGFFSSGLNSEMSLSGGTRIQDVLLNLVGNTDSEKGKRFLKTFFDERQGYFSGMLDEMKLCYTQLNEAYEWVFSAEKITEMGFVHGDFKQSNMMQSLDGNLKLIDFQYCSLGYREWDLAFYLSKVKSRGKLFKLQTLDTFEGSFDKPRLIFFFIIASLLHSDDKKFNQTYTCKVKPALAFLQENNKFKRI